MTSRRARFRPPRQTEEYWELGGAREYTPDELQAVLAAISLRADSDPDAFARDLNQCVWVALNHEDLRDKTPAALRERYWQGLSDKLRRTTTAIEGLNAAQRSDLENAMRSLAGGGDRPAFVFSTKVEATDAEGVPVAPVTHWLVEEELRRVVITLSWLKRACDLLEEEAQQQKSQKGGNRSSPAEDLLFECLIGLFERYSEDEPRAYKDRGSGEPRGALIQFIDAALRPLGFPDGRSAILAKIEALRDCTRLGAGADTG